MAKTFICGITLLVGMAIVAGVSGAGSRSGLAQEAAANSPAAQTKKRITVPAGTRILIRTVDAIDSS